MTAEELLFWIVIGTFLTAIFTMVTTVIQCIEMWILIKNQRATNEILSHPGDLLMDGIIQFALDLLEDNESRTTFFQFVNACGAAATPQIKELMISFLKELGEDETAQKAFFDFMEDVGAAAYKNTVETMKTKVKDTIKKEIPVPRKHRWIIELGREMGILGESSSTNTASTTPTGLRDTSQL